MFKVVRPFIDRYGYLGILDVFLFIYLFSFIAVLLTFYYLYYRPIVDPAPLKSPIKESHRYAIRLSLVILFIYLVWSDRLWPLLSGVWELFRNVVSSVIAFADRFFD